MTLWQRLCAQAPRDPEALSALAALYEHHERWRELAAVLEQQLAVAGDDTAPTLVEQLALVWTRLGEHARAEAAWRRVAALRPARPIRCTRWCACARRPERWSELAELLERLAA